MDKTYSFAILAPVPEMHLISVPKTINKLADDSSNEALKVAFGSMAFEIFRKVDELRGNKAVFVFIYASHAADQPLHSQVTWHCLYIGHIQSRNGRYPGNEKHRPPTTSTDKPTWAIYWEVKELKLLDSPLKMDSIKGLDKKSNYTSRFIPEGPLLIEYPHA